jgi:hypothetical protein
MQSIWRFSVSWFSSQFQAQKGVPRYSAPGFLNVSTERLAFWFLV